MNGDVDVIVVGGGLAGLTAAATAAGDGARVIVLDGRSVGGRARSVRRDGFVLNEGGHALYAGGRAVLEALGVRVAGSAPPITSYHAVWDGEVVPFPLGPAAIGGTDRLGAGSKAKLGEWFSDLGGHIARAGDRSVGEWLDDERARPDLRTYLLTLLRLTTFVARPEHGPARYLLAQLGAGGVVYVDGGWQTLVDQLARVCRAVGVSIGEHDQVTGVAETRDGWLVSTTRRDLRAHSVVLSSGGPAVAATLLGHDDAGWVERAGAPVRVSCLDIASSSPAVDFPYLLSADEPLYVSQQAPLARVAPTGQGLYTAMRYLEPDDRFSPAENRAVLERHCERAGVPASGRVLERFLAALVVTWGSPQVGLERPTGCELASRRVFAAGDWVGQRLLADASILSGATAGRAAARATVVT